MNDYQNDSPDSSSASRRKAPFPYRRSGKVGTRLWTRVLNGLVPNEISSMEYPSARFFIRATTPKRFPGVLPELCGEQP